MIYIFCKVQVESSYINTGDLILNSGKKTEKFKSNKDKIESSINQHTQAKADYRRGGKGFYGDRWGTMYGRPNNERVSVIKVEIATSWPMNWDSSIKVPTTTKKLYIDKQSTLYEIKFWFRAMISDTTFGYDITKENQQIKGKYFDINATRIRFINCIFDHKTWLERQNEKLHDKNNDTIYQDCKILDLFDVKELPKKIKLYTNHNSNEIENLESKYGYYNVNLKYNMQRFHNCIEYNKNLLTNNIKYNNNDEEIIFSKNESVDPPAPSWLSYFEYIFGGDGDNSSSCDKKSSIESKNNNSDTKPSKPSKASIPSTCPIYNRWLFDVNDGISVCEYKRDDISKYNYSKYEKYFTNLFEEYELHKLSDDQLYGELSKMYKIHVDDMEQELKNFDPDLKVDALDDTVNKKYTDRAHKRMGYPLTRSQLLSLLLYTDSCIYQKLTKMCLQSINSNDMSEKPNDHCNDNKNDNDDDIKKKSKWMCYMAIFDYVLYIAISKLSELNDIRKTRDINGGAFDWKLCCGLRNTQWNVDMVNINSKNKEIEFIKHSSFTWLPTVASQYCKLDDKEVNSLGILLNDLKNVVWADVSWISKHKNEFEVLVRRNSRTTFENVFTNSQRKLQVVLLGNKIDNLSLSNV